MGVDQLPFLPTRRSSLTLFPDSIHDDSCAATRRDNTSNPTLRHRNSSLTHDRNTEKARWKDFFINDGSTSQTRRDSRGDNESSNKNGRTHVFQTSKSVKPRRSRSSDGISRLRKSLSSSLPTVQEFQRASFAREDEQVFETFRRSRSWGDVIECRNHHNDNKNVRLSKQSRRKRLSVATTARSTTGVGKGGRTGVILTALAVLPKSRPIHPDQGDHRFHFPSSAKHPTVDIDVNIADGRVVMEVSTIIGLSSQEQLQATLQSVEKELYQTYLSKYGSTFNKRQASGIATLSDDTSNSFRHPEMTDLPNDASKLLSHPSTIRCPESSNQFLINRSQSMPFHTKGVSDVQLKQNVGMASCLADESLPMPETDVAFSSWVNENEMAPFSRSTTIMLPAGATRPAFGDCDRALGRDMCLATWQGHDIPKNTAAPISPKRVTSPWQTKRKSMTPEV
jgi:hypothetical protein